MPQKTASTTPTFSSDAILEHAVNVIDVEIEGLQKLKQRLGNEFIEAVSRIEACTLKNGRVIVTGMGKSGHIGKKIAATFSSTGTPAIFLHPAEGSHGDLGTLTEGDLVLAISNSGETPEILGILPLIKRMDVDLIAITGGQQSTLARQSNVVLDIGSEPEAWENLAPTTSTTVTLALGDALAIALLKQKGFTPDDFALFHPAGTLGKRLLLKVEDLMHTGESLPVIAEGTPFLDALMEITGKKLGVGIIVNKEGVVQGILTDGDIRRGLTDYPDIKAIPLKDLMTKSPKTIAADELAVSALRKMEEHKITVLLVNDADGKPLGLVHTHDILKTGIS